MRSLYKVHGGQWLDHSEQGQGSLRSSSTAPILFQLQREGLGVDGD